MHKIKNPTYKKLLDFVNNVVDFLSIRENPELFGAMNEFYNMILKSIYMVSLNYKQIIFQNNIAHIQNPYGGRIDALRPMKTKPFE